MEIYLSEISWGDSYEHGQQIVYVGTDMKKAEQACNNVDANSFPYNEDGYKSIYVWEDGKHIKTLTADEKSGLFILDKWK